MMWTWRKTELHQVGDALLATATVWILHAVDLRIGILIQGLESFAVLVLWFVYLIVARRGALCCV